MLLGGIMDPQSEVLAQLFIEAAISLVGKLGEFALEKISSNSSISSAINAAVLATSDAYPTIEGVDPALRKWCKSPEFDELIGKVKNGQRDLTDASLISSFIQTTEFYCGENTEQVARQVLTTFVQKILEQLYMTEAGLAIHAEREEVHHIEQLGAIGQAKNEMSTEFRNMMEMVRQRLPPKDWEESPEVKEKILFAKIDQARNLLDQGKAKTSRSILIQLRQEISNQVVSDELQYRVASYLGFCALELGEIPIAKTEFDAALKIRPTKQHAMANAAFVLLIEGKTDDALQLCSRARVLGKTDSHTTSAYLQCLHKAGKTEEIRRLILEEPWIVEDSICSLFIGKFYLDQRDYDRAEAILKESIKKIAKEPQAHMLLASVIVTPIQETLRADPPLPWRMDSGVTERIEEAERILTQAVSLLEQYENRSLLHTALASRAGIRAMLDHFEDALRDCDRILVEDATHDLALRNKGLLLLQTRRPSEAIQCFLKIKEEGEHSATVLPLAAAYYETDQAKETIQILTPIWAPDSRQRDQIHIADLLFAAYTKLANTSAIEDIFQSLIRVWPNDPDALTVLANQRNREGKVSDAIGLLREALAYSRNNQRDRTALLLGDTLYSQHNYAEAAKVYETIVDKRVDNTVFRKYLISLYNTGSHKEALALARALRGSGDAIPVVSEIEALILEYVGDLDQAKVLRKQLSVAEPSTVNHRIKIALLDLRLGDLEGARQVLSSVGFEEVKDNADALIQVAQARALLNMEDVLPFAYRARKVGFQDPDTHLVYLNLFLQREEKDRQLLEPNQVGVDCVVHLKRGDDKKSYTILGDDRVNSEKGELTLTDPLAMRLLGHKKGDQIVLKAGPLEELSYEIAGIQSKYVAAFQETFSEFSTRFPEEQAFNRLEISGNDFSKFFAVIDQTNEMQEKAMQA
jgi:tetratricopeptide (TPR) repeat protein